MTVPGDDAAPSTRRDDGELDEATRVVNREPGDEATRVVNREPGDEATRVVNREPGDESTPVVNHEVTDEATRVVKHEGINEATRVVNRDPEDAATRVVNREPEDAATRIVLRHSESGGTDKTVAPLGTDDTVLADRDSRRPTSPQHRPPPSGSPETVVTTSSTRIAYDPTHDGVESVAYGVRRPEETLSRSSTVSRTVPADATAHAERPEQLGGYSRSGARLRRRITLLALSGVVLVAGLVGFLVLVLSLETA